MSYRCTERAAPSVARRAQRGVALITVLLVFVLATIMTTAMLRASYLAIHRTGNLISSTQARYYAFGAEELGRLLLQNDAGAPGTPNQADSLGEEWAREGMEFKIDEGILSLEIIDQSGLFNLNNLIDKQGRLDAAAVARFSRLLTLLDVNPALAEVIADWADADNQTLRGGSEQSAYGVAVIPSQPFVEVSELQAIPGVDAEVWQKLADRVAALPERTKLNVNTAPQAVLQAYAASAPAQDVERFVHSRTLQPARSADDASLAGMFTDGAALIDVKSAYFMMRSHAEYQNRHVRLDSLMRRDAASGKVVVVGRSDATKL